MNGSDANSGYTGLAKLLHWAILGLLAVQFVLAWAMPHIKRDTQPDTLINLPLPFGVLILGLAVVRLGWRMTHAEPPPEHGPPPWQPQRARAVHWLLYLLLFVVPDPGLDQRLMARLSGHAVRPARGGRALSLFRASRPCAAADVAGKLTHS